MRTVPAPASTDEALAMLRAGMSFLAVTGSGCFPALVPVADDAGTGEIDDCGFSAVRLAGGSASMHSRA